MHRSVSKRYVVAVFDGEHTELVVVVHRNAVFLKSKRCLGSSRDVVPMIYTNHLAKTALAFALCTPAFAITVQSPTCEIQGDPDIYGVGIRCSFYLQWASLVLILVFCPHEGAAHRTASTITTLAVYINAFRSSRHGSLVAIDFPLLWYLASILTFFNWPVTSVGLKRNGGSQAVVLVVLAMYYLAGPWVYFKGLQIGRQPGCDVKYVIFAPISIYSKGLSTFMKVVSIMTIIPALLSLFIATKLVRAWFESWSEDGEEEPQKANLIYSRILGGMQLVTGSLAIAFTEMILKANRITFPDTHITDSGQLIPLLIGIFTFIATSINALRATIGKTVKL
jgi:hypothetical protein